MKAAASGRFPNTEEVIAAFEHLEWNGLSGPIRMAHGNGHQAIADIPVGRSIYRPELGHPVVTDVVYFNAECVNPAQGWTSHDWIEAGFPGAKCD